ncbi:LysE family translocator [Robbsia sp. Bb-Pol-6]|uniref:LysE family translocator n=1 Tax=Robbsia betulipollinis TaxID=2981849 RepID=A0ABT3ZL25_9BURK|nr:LysE family translocator [Robbsia betulipollinis]MCY0386645.1 LysE family translocator [Robbsia betulipollinis]
MTFHTWCLFALAYLATTLSPGPNVLLVIRNTIRYGSRGTAATIAGNLVSQAVVVTLVALGVGAVLAAMPPLFIAMKIVGAVYLIYLGVKQLRSAGPRAKPGTGAPSAPVLDNRKVFREALIVSGSNPKTLIFFCAFMPQFISHDHALPLQFVVMYLTCAGIVALVYTVYAFSVRRLHGGLGKRRWLDTVKRGSGLIFVALGIKLLTARQA